MSYVESELKRAADTYKKKNVEYGNGYHKQGKILKEIFPDGIILSTEKDFVRLGLFNAVLGKLIRYSAHLQTGGHHDSLHDAMVYAAMLSEMDHELKMEEENGSSGEMDKDEKGV